MPPEAPAAEQLTTAQAYWHLALSQMVRFAPSVIGALLLFLVGWIIAGVIGRIVGGSMRRAKIDETLTRFLSRTSRWLVLVAAVISILGIFGVETTSFAAVIGAAGLAVGLAFQGALSNVAAGVMLLVFRPFKVGDVINAAGQTGKVEEIELFTTIIDTFDNRRIIVPNGVIFGSTIENVTFHSKRRVDVDVGASYDADIDRTREVLDAAARGVQGVLEDPAPAVLLLQLGASSVDWSVRVWANASDFGNVKQALIRAVKNGLDEAGIGIPYPQLDVHLRNAAVTPAE